jgi:phosphoribosyl 1,2-cyclic phosphodiesterase
MSLLITSLNSGSNGNCYYVGTRNEAVLVDAGISCRETERRMNRLGLDINSVKAIFISHEHNDHINGLATLSKKYQLPVYITQKTQRNGRGWVEQHLVRRFLTHESIGIGGLKVKCFPKAHDAQDPHSFMISMGSINVGVFTDIGKTCPHVISHFRQCHAVFLESNYDAQMLMNGSYPAVLKKRITSGHGHLSNTEALDLFRKHRPPFLTHLILSHLSKNNNCPEIVKELFSPYAGHTNIIIAPRDQETPLFEIADLVNHNQAFTSPPVFSSEQLSLF